ncbi:hypothetical protein EV361DRAFT_974036 [Lentinula raphanica]|nr:hypothetical protein EV361DRAFT_974036 [Lentinula raphanica]
MLRYDSNDPVVEYNNPDLFPGMFPTLYPLGIGGFENRLQNPHVSLDSHARHLLDQSNRAFCYHHFFPFVVLNVIQRLGADRFHSVGPSLLTVTPTDLLNLAEKLKREHTVTDLSTEEQKAYRLLHEVNIISAKIPGSQASKLTIRHELRSYFGYFGLPHLWFTPIFQVFYGDSTINLDDRYPDIIQPRSERAYRLARDPVAAADFF